MGVLSFTKNSREPYYIRENQEKIPKNEHAHHENGPIFARFHVKIGADGGADGPRLARVDELK